MIKCIRIVKIPPRQTGKSPTSKRHPVTACRASLNSLTLSLSLSFPLPFPTHPLPPPPNPKNPLPPNPSPASRLLLRLHLWASLGTAVPLSNCNLFVIPSSFFPLLLSFISPSSLLWRRNTHNSHPNNNIDRSCPFLPYESTSRSPPFRHLTCGN